MAQELTKSEYEQLRSGEARSTVIEVLSPHIEIKYEIGRAWVTLLCHGFQCSPRFLSAAPPYRYGVGAELIVVGIFATVACIMVAVIWWQHRRIRADTIPQGREFKRAAEDVAYRRGIWLLVVSGEIDARRLGRLPAMVQSNSAKRTAADCCRVSKPTPVRFGPANAARLVLLQRDIQAMHHESRYNSRAGDVGSQAPGDAARPVGRQTAAV